MNILQLINTAVLAIGIPSIIVACITVGKKFHSLETLEIFIKDDLKPELTTFRDHATETRVRLSVVETKLDGFAKANSPLSLTPQGKRALVQSGLKNYIDTNKDLLVAAITSGEEKSPYDIQRATDIFFDAYEFPKDVEATLKDYAFNNGISLDVLLRVGALYLRDVAIESVV